MTCKNCGDDCRCHIKLVPTPPSIPRDIDWAARDFESNLLDKFMEAYNLLQSKHRDYGPRNISRSPGGPLNGLQVRMWDKLARIEHITKIDGPAQPQHESLRDSFIDLANYAIIGIMCIDGDWPSL
jgi:hypothetical protein